VAGRRDRDADRPQLIFQRIAAVLLACCFAAGVARADDAPSAANPPAASPPAENSPAPNAPDAGSSQTAVNDVGRSIFVVNDVDGKSGDAPPQHIAVNDDILFEEDITTGEDAKAVIEFRDGSTFEIGPDAAVRIDSFVFNPEESTSRKAIQVTHGVFRYVSGYVASDQDTTIKTPHGQMGIRGSVAAGAVATDLPDFVYLGEGSATFSNAGGSTPLQPGNSIAVPSADAPPMAPADMPAPVAAQALQVIEKRLPPRAALTNRPAADDAWLKRAGAADLVPAAEQRRFASAAATGRPPPAIAGRGRLAAELGLLVEGNRIGLFAGHGAARTAEQTAFLARAARDNPGAGATLRRFDADARIMHGAAMTAGTAFVIRGVGHAAGSPEVMRRVTAAAVRANPGAAALINRHARESFHGDERQNRSNERGGPNRPGNREPAQHRPAVHPQNDFERRQNNNLHTPQNQQRTQRTPPDKRQPNKEPPRKKKGDERDDRR
jgi:FecR protein